MDHWSTCFANNLIKYRRYKKLSQEQLAEFVLCSSKTVSKWENGISIPSVDTIIRIANILEVNLDMLLCEEKEYYSGIDGGGTKTKIALVDNNDEIVFEKTYGPFNPSVIGFNNCKELLLKAINEVCNGFISFSSIHLSGGIAGVYIGNNIAL